MAHKEVILRLMAHKAGVLCTIIAAVMITAILAGIMGQHVFRDILLVVDVILILLLLRQIPKPEPTAEIEEEEPMIGKIENLKSLTAGDIMIRNPSYCRLTDTATQASKLMSKHRLKHLPVVNEEKKVVGVVALRDLNIYSIAFVQGLDGLKSTYVKDVMIPRPWTVKEYVKFRDIFNLMLTKNTGYVPVVDDDGKLKGAVSRDGVLETFGYMLPYI